MTKASFHVITVFPEMIATLFSEGVVGQAAQKGLITIDLINPRKYSTGVHQAVDDRPFGGGDGMVMMADPLEQALLEARQRSPATATTLYLSPQGEKLTDAKVRNLASDPHLILICGRYGGIDQRFLVKNQIQEVSIGDYVLSGGELAASVVIDAVSRQIPGVLGHAQSADRESFAGGLLEAPLFTRPREWAGLAVPEVLLSGHHSRIQEWQLTISRFVTFLKRPDLKPFDGLSPKERGQCLTVWNELSSEDKKSLGLASLSDSSLRPVLESRPT